MPKVEKFFLVCRPTKISVVNLVKFIWCTSDAHNAIQQGGSEHCDTEQEALVKVEIQCSKKVFAGVDVEIFQMCILIYMGVIC